MKTIYSWNNVKLSLSSDYGSAHHMKRIMSFAQDYHVERFVYWKEWKWAYPFLLAKYPGLVAGEIREQRLQGRESLSRAAAMADQAGVEFWCFFPVLTLAQNTIARDCLGEHERRVLPGLVNAGNEPDMSGDLVYQILRDELDEIRELAPNLAGIEMWIMECAEIRISNLKHQVISHKEIYHRIVDTVYHHCAAHGLKISLDLHAVAKQILLDAARKYPDMIVSGDNTPLDFHLDAPFSEWLRIAAATNPVTVHFDLYGEYWGRNFLPTCAMAQYAEHLEEARKLGVVAYLDGRISCGHDGVNGPHDNVLPSRRRYYPALAEIKRDRPIPNNIMICGFDTLGGFNAEFFCRRARDPSIRPLDVVREFLQREFGNATDELAQVLMDVERVAVGISYFDRNCFTFHSVLPRPNYAKVYQFECHLTTPAGMYFPSITEPDTGDQGRRGYFVPSSHRAAGVEAIIAEKRNAVRRVRELRDRADAATLNLAPADRAFILKHFDDWVVFADACAVLIEALAHYYHLRRNKTAENYPVPDRQRLKQLLDEMEALAVKWHERQPYDECQVSKRLRDWIEVISADPACA